MAKGGKSTRGKRAFIQLRVTDAQKKELARAAENSGLSLSSWLLSVGLREARLVPAAGKK